VLWFGRRTLLIVVTAAISLWVDPAKAAVVEETRRITVRVEDAGARAVEHAIVLTIFRDSERARAPFLLFNHGRSGNPLERAAMGRARYSVNSRYFVERGFVVIVPTRIGYGVAGGPDIEDSGPCRNKQYPRAYHAAVQQSEQILIYLRTLPFVVAAVNFAGGAGGRPDVSPGEPCGEPRIRDLFAAYGRTARIPTLWLYSENDRYWGPRYPAQWYEAYRTAGGQARLVSLPPLTPPLGTDGHSTFTRNPNAWRPSVETFLRENGF
jgi:hypothetical protein